MCLLRYRGIGGLGFQAALGAPVFTTLQQQLGCNFEVFASPFNCFYGAFCSAYLDVDDAFGSQGSFATFMPTRGSYQVNPPFVSAIIDEAATHMLKLLDTAGKAGEALSFCVVLPGWTDCAGYNALGKASRWLRKTLLVAAIDHGFIDGGQHTRERSYRESPYDTMLFILQTDAANARWPIDDNVIAELERAFASCTPSAEELASVDTKERVHRNGAARKKRKWKRAGVKTREKKAARGQ